MESEVSQVNAIEKAVTPTLLFTVKLTTTEEPAVLVGVSGHLRSAAGLLLAPLFELDENRRSSTVPLPGRAARFDGDRSRVDHYLNLGAQLGPKELDHIEEIRAKDPRTDVHFKLNLTLRLLVPRAMTLSISEAQWGKLVGIEGAGGVRTSPGQRLSFFHEVQQGDGLLAQKLDTEEVSKRIPAMDWAKDIAPRLGLGRFAVFEIPDGADFTGLADDRVQKAIKAARKANDLLRAGEWESVCEELRHVWETLRDLPLAKEALEKDGFSPEAAGYLNHALVDLFNLASKFVHSLDRNNTSVLPEIHPKKEDAYLVYTTTMAALNLIARKAQRVAGRR